jgi:hypothetical protein
VCEGARRRHAVVHIAHADIGARVRILVIALVLHAAVAEHDVRTLAEGLQQWDQLRVVELEQRGEDMAVVLVRLDQQARQLLVHRAAQKITDLVARRRDDFAELLVGMCLRQKPREPLARDDAAVEIAGDSPRGFRADLDHLAPRRRVRSILSECARRAQHGGDAIGDLVAWVDHEIRPHVFLDRPFRGGLARARLDLRPVREPDPTRHRLDGEPVLPLGRRRTRRAAGRPLDTPG